VNRRSFGGAAGTTWSALNPCAGMNAASGGPKNGVLRWEAGPGLWTMRSGGCKSCLPAEAAHRKLRLQNRLNL
jgi:hypothetical protein